MGGKCALILLLALQIVLASNEIPRETAFLKSRAEELGDVLRRRLDELRGGAGSLPKLDLVFLVDASSSVGPENFASELRFVRKLVSDLEVSSRATRVALVTFASAAERHVDTVSAAANASRLHKCALLEEALPSVNYSGGATFTLGAMREAQAILRDAARSDAKRVVFLLTDGFSNGGDPRESARVLREELGATVFTFGVRSGNTRELAAMASRPTREHAFLLPSFEQFAALARRALHQDLRAGATSLEIQDMSACKAVLCTSGSSCGCNAEGTRCVCDTLTGHSACVCPPGHHSSGIQGDCTPCPSGTYGEVLDLAEDEKYTRRCVPCPDPNHESKPGSTQLGECKCRPGFTSNSTHPRICNVLECPSLEPPTRGSFVGGPCSRVFNAACGVTCATGHRLVGSSIRLCRANGTWSGQPPTCARRECPSLPSPSHGWVKCGAKRARRSTEARSVDATCKVGCKAGFVLLGSRSRTCLALGAWDGLPSTCKAVTCPPVPVPRRTLVSPEICAVRSKQLPGQECRFSCAQQGFALRGTEIRRCEDTGRWTGAKPKCVDVQPPEMQCLEDMTVNTLPEEDFAVLNITLPEVIDNSGAAVRLRVSPPLMLTGGVLVLGKHRVTVKVTDLAGNFAVCRFTVTVIDREAPEVLTCDSPPSFLTAADEAHHVTWTEPTFIDNSGKPPQVTQSHDQNSSFPRGVTEVHYEAVDDAGNKATCVINITVQGLECDTPEHGQCTYSESGACSLVCDEGYSFALELEPNLTCDPVIHESPFPDCTVIALPDSFSQPLFTELIETDEDCDELANSIEAQLSAAVLEACGDGAECSVQRMNSSCHSLVTISNSSAEIEEEDNTLPLISRRKRASNKTKHLQQPFSLSSPDPGHKLTFRIIGKLRIGGSPTNNGSVRATLGSVRALLTSEGPGKAARNFTQKLAALKIRLNSSPTFGCPKGSVIRASGVCVQCPRGTYLKGGASECSVCERGHFQSQPGQSTCLPCPAGTSTRSSVLNTKRQHCRILCGPGTKSRDGVAPCSPCPHGTYQSAPGQRECMSCPQNTTTQRRSAHTPLLCKARCVEGWVSKSGLQPCLQCPVGYSQLRIGQRDCLPGPNVCAAAGECFPPLPASHPCLQVPCHSGATCLPFPTMPRLFKCHCPPGFTGTFCDERVKDACSNEPCENNATCQVSEDTCSECKKKNNSCGTCSSDNFTACPGCDITNKTKCDECTSPEFNFTCKCEPGFEGILCEEDIDECADQPCGDRGFCIDLPGGFECDCSPGYAGDRCEIIKSACAVFEPCVAGLCEDTSDGYKCTCPASRRGMRCELDFDPCEEMKCQHGGTCVPDPIPHQDDFDIARGATCICLTGYHGTRCEKITAEHLTNPCVSSPCMNGGTCRRVLYIPRGFSCSCGQDFAGETCNITLRDDAVLRFPDGGGLGYVLRENALKKPLKELTLCSWLRTADTHNYGTPVSYATPQQDNSLALTDYSGFVVYVNGERAVTDVAVNDGAWHLVCLQWASQPRGAWRLYKDGALSDEGDGLASHTQIPGGGTLVLGQEQDSPGGSFSTSQSFLGRLGPTALWPRLLPVSRLRAMFERCGDEELEERQGDDKTTSEALWSWRDALTGIRGRIQLESPALCSGCSPPLIPLHGHLNMNGSGTGSVATFSCSPGFRPVGARRMVCDKRGIWRMDSLQPPSCQRLSCGRLPAPPLNAILEGFNHEFGSRLHVKCLPGFVPSSSNTFIECLTSGKWSPLPPPCREARCSMKGLVTVDHGQWHYLGGSGEEEEMFGNVTSSLTQEVRVGEQVELLCDVGLVARGASVLTCMDGGLWEEGTEEVWCRDPSLCTRPPPRVQNARTPLVVGIKARYSCLPGYNMRGSPLVTCLDGWYPLPFCVPIPKCPAPPAVENAHVERNGTWANYTCLLGFTMKGNPDLECFKSNITWPTPPTCDPITCEGPPDVDNGSVMANATHARYKCTPGFELKGESDLECNKTGHWPEAPVCKLITCDDPPNIQHGFVSFNTTNAEYSCGSGFTMNGESEILCSEIGTWPEPPECKPIICEEPLNIQHGSVSFNNTSARYNCGLGFTLHGENELECNKDGTWPEPPVCKVTTCGEPPSIQHGSVAFDANNARYTCETGYTINGPAKISCDNGVWSSDTTRCELLGCLPPRDIEHGSAIVTKGAGPVLLKGAFAEYKCSTGHQLVGPRYRKCLGIEFQWSSVEPYCKPIQDN